MKNLVVAGLAFALMSGCATSALYGPDGKLIYRVESRGILRDSTATIKEPDGTIVIIEGRSKTADILLGLNELLGTATATAEKLGGAAK